MSDKVYEEFNNISFNEAEYNLVEDTLTEMEIKKLKNNLKKNIYKTNRRHFGIAVSLALAVILGITIATPAFAKTIGLYSPVLDALYEKLGYYKEYKDFSQYIGISKEDKGYKFTLDKLVADDHSVLIALRINKPGLNEKENATEKKSDFAMNSDLTGTRRGTIMGSSVEERVVDKNTSIVLLENETAPGKSLPKRFKMQVNIHSMLDEKVNANFDLSVSREQTQKDTIVKKNLGQSTIGENLKIKLQVLTASPMETRIKYSYDGKLNTNQHIGFYTYDDTGRIYMWDSSSADDSGWIICTLDKIEEDAKKLYIIPYIETYDDLKENTKVDFRGHIFSLDTKREFDFKEDGKVDVYKVEKNNNSIKFYYSLKGVKSAINKRYIIGLYENSENNIYSILSNAKVYKLGTSGPDNYCIEYDNIDASKGHMYNVDISPVSNVIEGTPIEVNLR